MSGQPDGFPTRRTAKHSQLQTGPARAQGLQDIFIGAKQLQTRLAGLATNVHDHNFCVLTLWMEEPEAFQRNPLAGDN